MFRKRPELANPGNAHAAIVATSEAYTWSIRPQRKSASRRSSARLAWKLLGVIVLVFIVRLVTQFAFIPPLEIGSETTFVVGPKLPDGEIDFESALHGYFSDDVNPDDNAAVPLHRAYGIAEIPPEFRRQYFDRLGIPPLPEDSIVGLTQDDFLKSKLDAEPIPDLTIFCREGLCVRPCFKS